MTITLTTGANKGLGYETARRLTELGHTVYLGAGPGTQPGGNDVPPRQPVQVQQRQHLGHQRGLACPR